MRHPNVPESLEGWSILHRMFRFDRRRFDALSATQQEAIGREATAALQAVTDDPDRDVGLVQTLGHKADLMLTGYARSFDALGEWQVAFDRLALADYLEPRDSYVSMLELGLYDFTPRMHAQLRDRGLQPNTEGWNAAYDELLEEASHDPRNAGRLWAKIPQRRYACFYPMNKRRGESENWYALPYDERGRMMVDHGKIGRSWHGRVNQVISGSIGFDDWEWGVDLYADDPVVFKRLVYEMRFDAASSRFGEFGAFWSGMQFSIAELPRFLDGSASPQLRRVEAQVALR